MRVLTEREPGVGPIEKAAGPCRRVGDDKKSTLVVPASEQPRTPRGTGWMLSLPRFLPARAPLAAMTDCADVFSPGQCARPALPTLGFLVSFPPPVARCDVICRECLHHRMPSSRWHCAA